LIWQATIALKTFYVAFYDPWCDLADKRCPVLQPNQEEVIAFLSEPLSYRGVVRVDRIETHANLVFLAGSDAWKIKRAVRFAYMDFSTLEKRRAACAREIEVNQRLAPALYLGAVAITRTLHGGLEFGGNGEVIEWAVHMRRFQQRALLSNIAAGKGISPQLAKTLADTVFESHRQADRSTGLTGEEQMRQLLDSLCGGLAKSHVLDAQDVRNFCNRAEGQLCRAAAALNDRAHRGCIRRCHGDLHLANIVLWQGRPMLYDAIEFDEMLATIDTLYDLAFLLMDLDWYRQRPAANVVLNRYYWHSRDDRDWTGLQTLPLFLGVRAGVRAMVVADRAAQQTAAASQSSCMRAQTYLHAAIGYLTPAAPQLIAVAGLSGSGKSTLAAALAPLLPPAPGAMHLRSDLQRKTLFGVPETVRLAASAYTPEVSRIVYEALLKKARIALAAGQSVVVDAVYASFEERRSIESVGCACGVPFQGLWLQTDPDQLIARVTARRDDASDATAGVVREQLRFDAEPLSAAWTAIDSSQSPEETLARAAAVAGVGVTIGEAAASRTPR
jgi:uncharacterized protein